MHVHIFSLSCVSDWVNQDTPCTPSYVLCVFMFYPATMLQCMPLPTSLVFWQNKIHIYCIELVLIKCSRIVHISNKYLYSCMCLIRILFSPWKFPIHIPLKTITSPDVSIMIHLHLWMRVNFEMRKHLIFSLFFS